MLRLNWMIVLGMTLLTVACQVGDPLESQLASDHGSTPAMLHGYDVHTHAHSNVTCVEVDPTGYTMTPPTWGTYEIDANLSQEARAKLFEGYLSVNLNFNALTIEGEIDFLKETERNRLSTNIVIFHKVVGGEYKITDVSKVRFTDHARAVIEDPTMTVEQKKQRFRELCGTAFVSSQNLGALYAMNMSIQFGNLKDRMEFEARLRVELADLGSGEAQVESIFKQLSSDFNVTIEAYQQGGEPSRVFSVLNTDNIARCQEANMRMSEDDLNTRIGHCQNVFDAFVNYSQTYKSQFQKDGVWQMQNFSRRTHAESYTSYAAVEGFSELFVAGVSPAERLQLAAIREQITSWVNRDRNNQQFVEQFIANTASGNPDLIDRAIGISQVIDLRLDKAGLAAKACYNKDVVYMPDCLEVHEEMKLKLSAADLDYNINDLQTPVNTLPYLCSVFGAWNSLFHTGNDAASILMNNQQVEQLVAIFNAPEVMAATDRQHLVTYGLYKKKVDGTNGEYGAISPDHESFSCAENLDALNLLRTITIADVFSNAELLANIPNLREIKASDNYLPDAIYGLEDLPGLETLTLANSDVLTLKGLAPVSGLEKLSLGFNRGLQSSQLAHLANMRFLQTLDLRNTGIESLASLPNLKKLRTLRLSGTDMSAQDATAFAQRVTDGEFPRLQSLVLPADACDAANSFPDGVEVDCQ